MMMSKNCAAPAATADRRTFLKMLGGGAAAAAASGSILRALANPPGAKDEFFMFIHAQGGWDVTLWSDPRNEFKGLVDPATTKSINTLGLTQWKDDAAIAPGESSFVPVQPAGSKLVFGPAIGDLATHYDRLTVVNGLAVNTVSHQDGTVFASSGRHLAGGRVPATSIDACIGNEFGAEQLFPVISVRFPSSFVGSSLDRRAMPLLVDSIGSMGRSLTRSAHYDYIADREAVTAMLSDEASDLAKRAADPTAMNSFSLQLQSLKRMLGGGIQDVFDTNKLKLAQPSYDYKGRFMGSQAPNAAFAIEAMKRNLVRSVGFALGSFDSHGADYQDHAMKQQETFNILARTIEILDATPHPTLSGHKLSEHTHIMVVSEFCRTPQINIGGGRDHYPSGSALIISPKFQPNTLFGATDFDQLLPKAVRTFSDGERAIAPPDVLATFLAAFGIDPRKYMRDGEVVKEMLKA